MRRLLLYITLLGFPLVATRAQQPNIVFIISDDAGFADWGFMDDYTQSHNPGQATSPVPTPNLDRLRDRGVLFTDAYTAAVCSPSRAAIMTGSYQQRIGYEFNINNLTNPDGNFEGLRSEDITIFERMGSRGYTTGAIGKWHVGGIPDTVDNGIVTKAGNRPPRQGVDEFFGILRGSRNYSVGPLAGDVTRALREMSLDANGLEVNNDIEANHSGEYVTNTFGQGAVDFIDRHYGDPDPFFLYVSFTAPHSPIGASPDRNAPGVSSNYGSMVFTMDKEIGRIMDKIDDPAGDGSINLRDETLIIFINDNGGASGNGTRNEPLRDWKGSTYEGGIRVPMIFVGSGVTATAGSTYSEPVHSIDVLATCHELAGGAPIQEIDGVNLLPFINGTAAGVPHEAIVVRSRGKYGIRMGDWKLTRNGSGQPELFDLTNSIDELSTSDVANDNPQVVSEMLRILTKHEIGFDKPRFHGLNSSADSINRNDRFRFSPEAAGGQNFTPDLVLVAPGIRNGGFESPAFGSDQHTFAEADEWTNIGTGTQAEAFIRTNLGRSSAQNAVISESGARVAAIDTGHTLADGEILRVSYWWRDASGWADGSDRIRFVFYTTADNTIAGAIESSEQLVSATSTANITYEAAEGFFTAGSELTGKRLFVSFDGLDGSGATNGFARVDDVMIERGTISGGGGGTSTRVWSAAGAWIDTDTGLTDTLLDIDAFASAVLEFPVSSGFSYVADNNMARATGEEFMLNKIVLSGTSNGDARSAEITGRSLLFTDSLEDEGATIENLAIGEDFSYSITAPILAWNRIAITGDGTAGLIISGEMSDFDATRPASFSKDGTSTVTLNGNHPFTGTATVSAGTLSFDDANLSGASLVSVDSEGGLAGKGAVVGDVSIAGRLQTDLTSGDRLDVVGGLVLAGATLEIEGLPTDSNFIIATYGQLDGEFAFVSGLPAGYQIEYHFGGNQIALVSGTDPYLNWAENVSGLSGAAAEFTADPNGDQIPNGVAFFLGADTANTNANPLLPTVVSSAGSIAFSFSRSDAASANAFQIRYSGDLSTWLVATDGVGGVTVEIADDGHGPGIDLVSANIPVALATGGNLYLQLSVDE